MIIIAIILTVFFFVIAPAVLEFRATQEAQERRLQAKLKRQLKRQEQPSRSRLMALIKGAVAFVGTVGVVAVLLPRLTVKATGDLSNYSSIAFVITNTNVYPLEELSVVYRVCQLDFIVGRARDYSPREVHCSVKDISSNTSERAPEEKHRLDADEDWTIYLKDRFPIGNNPINVAAADLGVTVKFDPWFLPLQREKTFAFKTVLGSDGNLRWRSYPLN